MALVIHYILCFSFMQSITSLRRSSFELQCENRQTGVEASGRRGMKTIKGPALFLAQFAGDEAPFDSWDSITKWAADCGYKGVQVPS